MPDIPTGWATVDAAVITVIGGLLAAMIAWVLRRLHRVQHQVTNSHQVNMRDDMDQKQDETREFLTGIRDDLVEVKKDIGGIRHELRTLHENDSIQHREQGRMREHLDELERTQPKKPHTDE